MSLHDFDEALRAGDFSVRTAMILEDLGAGSAEAFFRLGPPDLLLHPRAEAWILSEVRHAMDQYEVDPSQIAEFFGRKHPTGPLNLSAAPSRTTGCLWLDLPATETPKLKERIRALHIQHGLTETLAISPEERAEAPHLNPSTEWGPDEVLVVEDEPWLAVASQRWELAPPGDHPLARALSEEHRVISVSSEADRYSEVSVYEGGHAVSVDVQGEASPRPTQGAPLAYSVFERQARVAPELLPTLRRDVEAFRKAVGLSCPGFLAFVHTLDPYDGDDDYRDAVLRFVR